MQEKLRRLAAQLDERYFELSDNTENITPEASVMFQKARAAEALSLALSPHAEQLDGAIYEAIAAWSDLEEATRAAEAMLRAKWRVAPALNEAIRERAAHPNLRNDFARLFTAELGAPATTAAVDEAERANGYALHPFHRRLLIEVGNGGFGSGYGLIGLPGGTLNVDGYSLVELSRLLLDEPGPSLSVPVVVLSDWGCGTWAFIDCATGRVLTVSEEGLKDSGQDVYAWFEDWVSGVALWRRVFKEEQRIVQNPSTKLPESISITTGTLGVPYVRRR
jgi:hypothetical protein